MTEEELKEQLTKVITDKTLRREVHVIQYLLPIIRKYSIEYVEDVVARALKSTYERN